MTILVADALSMIAAVESGFLLLLPARCERIILTPTVVEELLTGAWIDALVTEEIEPLVEVVSLTQEDEALARQLAAEMAALGATAHPGSAEALALMSRADLAATLFLSEDEAALALARQRGVPARRFAALIANESGEESSPPAPPTALPRRTLPRTIEVDEETAALLDALLAQGVGEDASEVVRRAVRGLAAALA
jgi:hypothetical protein